MASPTKKPTKKKSYVYASAFDVKDGSAKRVKKTCPKCGDGIFMASHKDRSTCGKCGYMEKK